jgi:hypothetical protein
MDLYAEVKSIRSESDDAVWMTRRQDFIDTYGERTFLALNEIVSQDAWNEYTKNLNLQVRN